MLAGDICDADTRQSAIASMESGFGRMEILFNNAGVGAMGLFEDSDADYLSNACADPDANGHTNADNTDGNRCLANLHPHLPFRSLVDCAGSAVGSSAQRVERSRVARMCRHSTATALK